MPSLNNARRRDAKLDIISTLTGIVEDCLMTVDIVLVQLHYFGVDSCHVGARVVQEILQRHMAGKKVMTQRHVGSLVADIHRTLFYGGIVLYPPTNDAPDGELSLLCECAAMSFIIEQAGSLATTGKRALLDVIPDNNQRTPFYAGSKEDVEELLTYINNE